MTHAKSVNGRRRGPPSASPVDPQRKQLLERAADTTHQSLSAFVLAAASQHAEDVFAERTVIDLPPQAPQAFSDALAEPARVNERLVTALGRPHRFRWVA